jgi:hypothetical protein
MRDSNPGLNHGGAAKRFALLVGALASAGLLALCSGPAYQFPEYFSKDSAKALQMLAQKTFTKTDGYAEENVTFEVDEAEPLGEAGQLIARLQLDASAQRTALSLMLDTAGAIDAKQGLRAWGKLPIRVVLVCRMPEEVCRDTPALRVQTIAIPVAARIKFSLNPWSYDGSTYKRITLDGFEQTLVTGHQMHTVQAPPAPWKEADLLLAFPARTKTESRSLQVIQLRATLLQGEFAEEEPLPRLRLRAWLRPMGIGNWTIALAGLAMLGMGFIAWRERRADPNEDAPRVFGLLLLAWGWLLAAMPIAFHVAQGEAQGMLSYTATGLLFALSGLYAFFGRPTALPWFVLGYLLTVGWAYVELDATSRQFFMRIGMPTLIGLYVWHLARTGRLEAVR